MPDSFLFYQHAASETAVYPFAGYGQQQSISYVALGLTSEAGEVADLVKKAIRDDGGYFSDERIKKMQEELGDVLWYVAMMCDEFGFELDEIANANLKKLASRQKNDELHGR